MNQRKKLFFAAALIALGAGCIPEKRIVWSPDGKTAAVCAMNGMYFIDGEGNVLPPRLPNTSARCAWFKDGRRLTVVHVAKASGWNDVAPLFDEAQTADIKEQAARLKERLLAYKGDFDKFKIDPDNRMSPGQEEAIFIYVRDKLPEGLPEKLGDKWKELKSSAVNIWQLQLFELAGEQLKPGMMLLRTLDEIHQPKISPSQTVIGLVMTSEHSQNDAPCLHVVSTTGGPARFVAANVAMDYDWSPNGQSLAFIASNSPPTESGSVQLGSLTTLNVADERGELLKDWAERNDRVGLLFNPVMGVKWMSDGRLMFSAAEVTLPATSRDMPQRWTLFALDAKFRASVIRALGRDFAEPLDPAVSLFEVSPDETTVLLHGPKGRLSMYDLVDGTTTVIEGMDDADGKTRCLASWKSKSEISFVEAAKKTEGGKPVADVAIWSNGKSRTLSTAWPDEMKDGWLQGGQ